MMSEYENISAVSSGASNAASDGGSPSTAPANGASSATPDNPFASASTRSGIFAGVFCYVFWGLCPLYWKLLSAVDPFEIVAQRIIWCFVFTVAVCLIARHDFVSLLRDARARRFLIPAAIIIGINWSTYIFAVNTGFMLEAAIGYYINPLMSILLGVIVFREKLTRIQLVAFLCCAAGVVFFTVNYGRVPWMALLLSLTFAVYGAIKKKGGYEPIPAMTVESVVLVVPAIVLAIVLAQVNGSHAFLGDLGSLHGWTITLLLIGAGPITGFPLILFAKAANNIPMVLLGFIQYISPTINLLLGTFVFREELTIAHIVCFACIWVGLVLVSVESVRKAKAAK